MKYKVVIMLDGEALFQDEKEELSQKCIKVVQKFLEKKDCLMVINGVVIKEEA